MDKLSNLPLEISLHIINFVLPAELEVFAQVSRRIRELIHPLLDGHRALIQRHNFYYNNIGFSAIPALLTAIAENPLLGHYIRRFELTNQMNPTIESCRYLDATEFDRILSMLRENKLLESSSDDENRIRIDSAWRGGNDFGWFLMPLLLPLLPNLKELTLLTKQMGELPT